MFIPIQFAKSFRKKPNRHRLLLLSLAGLLLAAGCYLFYNDPFSGNTTTAYIEGTVIGRGERADSQYILKSVPVVITAGGNDFSTGPAYLVGYDPENGARTGGFTVIIPCTNTSDKPYIGLYGPEFNYINQSGQLISYKSIYNIGFHGSVRDSETRQASYADGLGPGETGYFTGNESLYAVDPGQVAALSFKIAQKTDANTLALNAPSLIHGVAYAFTQASGPDSLAIVLRNDGNTEAYVNCVWYLVLNAQSEPLYYNFINFAAWLAPGREMSGTDTDFLFYGSSTRLWTAAWVSSRVYTE